MNPKNPSSWPLWPALLVWAVLLAVMNVVWGSPLLTGYLADADDYLRMSRVFDLLDRAHYPSWLQPRLGPGGAVENGWSRLLDIPLAALMLLFQTFASRPEAALLTATVFPALALLALIFAALWYARAFAENCAAATLLAVCVMWDMLHQFMPGRVTHHDWQIVLTVLGYGALARLCRAPDDPRWPAIAGIIFATGLAIGADIVPWFALGVALVGVHFLVYGAAYERAAQRLGFAVTLATAIYFVLLVSPARYMVRQCDTISPTYLSFAAAVGVFWGAVSLLPAAWKSAPGRRAIVAAPLAALVFAGVYKLSPGCFHDIYGITDPLVRAAWLHRVVEAQPVLTVAHGKPLFALFMLGPVALAFIGALWAARVEKERHLLWLGLALILACGGALTFWQFRTLDYVQAIALAPLAWLFTAMARWIKDRTSHLTRTERLECEAIFLMAAIVLFSCAAGRHNPGQKQPPAARMQETCSIRDAAPALNTLPAPQMIAAYVDEGSEIIYRTPHWALAGDYHRDQEGIGASYRLFTAPDAAAARQIADKYKVGVILACPAQLGFWRSIAPQKDFFAAQLLSGETPPWLTRVKSKGAIRIYRVTK